MEPIIAAVMTTLAVLSATAVLSHARQSRERRTVQHRRMALERGLSHYQVLQIEHLSNGLNNATVTDLVLSPTRYNEAVQRYLESLTTTRLTTPEYDRIVHQLTRLRRRVHPPRLTGTPLQTSRQLPEGIDLFVQRNDNRTQHRACVWGVDEDHFALRFVDAPDPGTFRPNTPVTVSIVRPNSTAVVIRTVVRRQEYGQHAVLHLEHGACRPLDLSQLPSQHLRAVPTTGHPSRSRTQWNPATPGMLGSAPRLYSV